MKRILLMLLPALFLMAGCQKTYVVPNRTIIVDLPSRNWTLANDGRSYTSYIDVPELDRYMNEQGAVLVYLSFGEETYEQIPQVYKGESYTFITQPGRLVLEKEYVDGGIMNRPPQGMTVKIILMESEY